MPGIGIITNPHSKLNKRKPHTPELLGYILGEHGRLAITKSLSELALVANKFRDNNIEILAINGGDGTISKTLTAFIDAYGDRPLPKIALLRGGTMNVLANNIGIKGSPPRVLFRLCEAYSSDETPLKTVRLRSLKVNDAYGFLYADGVAYNVLDEFYQNKTGPIGAALLVLRIGISALVKGDLFKRMLCPTKIKLSTEQRQLEHESVCVMASSIERLPYGIKLFPKARTSPTQFQYLSVTCPPERLLPNLPAIVVLTKPKDYQNKIGGTASLLSIEAKTGYTYSLDGELFSSKTDKVTISLGPEIDFILV